ncbi:MAG: peptide chain release factor N(5)-glutamine methyltransferase [Pseudomonadota bacterium]
MPELKSVAQAIAHARFLGIDRLDAQLLLAHHLGRPRAWLLAHDEAAIGDASTFLVLLMRRAAGEPLAYLVGEREFHGLQLRVTPDVLIPRPDTETLVDWALELLADIESPRVLDLGTGSGAIALAIKRACPRARVDASDASPAALAVARENGERLALPVGWHLGDWWQAIDPALSFDLVVANPPYVAPGDPHLASLRHEPQAALVAQHQGLAALETIAIGAGNHLGSGAWLLLEHGFDQAAAVGRSLREAGFESVATRCDLAGHERVSGGRRATSSR